MLNQYHKELDEFYGVDEVDSFFYLLTDHYLGINRLTLALKPDFTIGTSQKERFLDWLSRLKFEEPIQYIIGETEFFGLTFKVNTHSLIPRPETEELVQWIIDKVDLKINPLKILDVGTGSGCIAITLAKYLPNVKVYALDVSVDVLNLAKENARLNKVDVTFIELDILSVNHPVIDAESNFDIIVSNPPYVRQAERTKMKNNVLKYEPDVALFVTDDNPLQFYEAITKFSVNNLNKNGMLFFEINQYLGNDMKALLAKQNFNNIELKKDMFGNDRMIKGIKI